MGRWRRRTLIVAVFIIILGGGLFVAIRATSGPSLTPAQIAARAAAVRFKKLTAEEKKYVRIATGALSVSLPTQNRQPAPPTPASLFAGHLPQQLVVSFVPYYNLGQLNSADYADSSELCYFGIQIGRGGDLTTPAGFVAVNTSAFSQFAASAHAADDQVLLTLSAFSKSVIDTIARHPQAVAARLNAEIAPLIASGGFQGVDLDIEGRWQSDRNGFTSFIRSFSASFRASAPERTIIVDTFPQSAGDLHSFYDFRRLAPVVNDFFVMAYAMESANNASANSPARAPSLGLSSVQSLMQFTKVVKPRQLILGLPFYGFDFPTESSRTGAVSTTPNPEAVTYSAVVGVGRPAFWDPVSGTPYSVFKEGTQWHETWFDNPLSIALKVALANEFHIAGTGAWALGMEGSDPAMLDALDGDTTPIKLPTGAAG